MRKDIGLALALLGLLIVGGLAGFLYFESEDGVENDVDQRNSALDLPAGPEEDGVRRRGERPKIAPNKAPEPEEPEPAIQLDVAEDEGSLRGVVRDVGKGLVFGAVLELRYDVSPMASQTVFGDVLAQVTSDEEGRYDFGPVPVVERLCLRVEHPEFSTKVIGSLGLSVGDTKTVDVTMLAGVAIEGQVTSFDDRPLAGVEVRLVDQARSSLGQGARFEGIAITDAEGRYRIEHLNTGSKRVWATKEGFATALNSRVFLRKEAPPQDVSFRLVKGTFIEGRILDQEGIGIEGASVTATPRTGPDGKRTTRPAYPSVLTGAGGVFRYEGLLEGTYTMAARARGFSGKGAFAQSKTGRTDVEIKMRAQPLIGGRVIDDRTGEPVANFALIASATPQLIQDVPAMYRRFSDASGRFEFEPSRSSGRIYLFAKARGFAGGVSEAIHLVEGQVPEDIEIRVHRGLEVTGTVLDEAGRPVLGAAIEFVATRGAVSSSPGFLRGVRSVVRKGRSDGDGRWVVRRMLAGRYRIIVRHADYADWTGSEVLEIAEGAADVEAPQITLTRGATVEGSLTPREGRRDSVSEIVTLRPAAGRFGESYRAHADREGRFRFERVAPGVYSLSRSGLAFAAGGRAEVAPMEIRVSSGETLSVQLP